MEEKYWIIEGYFPHGYWQALNRGDGVFRIETFQEMQDLWRKYTEEHRQSLRVKAYSEKVILWRRDISE